jgi:hypothetical protein
LDVDDDTQAEFTFDEIELSPLGRRLVPGDDSIIAMLRSVEILSTQNRQCSVESLTLWGEPGGLCEVTSANAKGRQTLFPRFVGADFIK